MARRPPMGNMKQMASKENMSALKRIFSLMLKDYKFPCFIVFISIIVSSVATLIGTLFLKSLIDDYIIPLIGSTDPDFSSLAIQLIKLSFILGFGILCSYLSNRIMVNVSQGTLKKVRLNLFTKMESLPIKYFDTHSHGDIMSVYTNDVDTLRQVMSQSVPQFISATITFVTTFVSMIALNIPLTLLSILMVVLMLAVTGKMAKLSGKYFGKQQQDLGAINGFIEEMMQGQKVVKVFCHEEKNIQKFEELNDNLRGSAYNANKIANIIMPINGNMSNITYVLCAAVGAAFALNGIGGLTLGMLVTFLTLNRSFTQPITQISMQLNAIVMAGAGAARIFNIIDATAEQDDGYVELVNARIDEVGNIAETSEKTERWAWKHPHQAEGTITYTKQNGDIVFDGVDFGYDEKKMVLHDIKMDVKSGQKIAFVGSTGAGKTTITNLINRFYDIQDGKIRYDGININKIRKPDLRRSLGVVLQDTHLFTGSVMDNIRYGRLDATDEECIAAAKLANAHTFIKRLPEGYNTKLTGDGSNLSQGQRQLISIARAAVADPPVLILDEATSSIDTRTEVLVQKGMDALMNGRTSFVIAHRLSTVRNADCIMVLEQGRIIERGSHQELLDQKGKYYQLYTGNNIGA